MCDLTPTITKTAYGKFLVVSPRYAPLKIGVLADTEDKALEKYAASYARFMAIISDSEK